jgi:hypothetical protein
MRTPLSFAFTGNDSAIHGGAHEPSDASWRTITGSPAVVNRQVRPLRHYPRW